MRISDWSSDACSSDLGTLDQLLASTGSITADYLNGTREVPVPAHRRKGSGKKLTVRGPTANNLRNVTATIPLGTFTCITALSRSGQSILTIPTLYPPPPRALTGALLLSVTPPTLPALPPLPHFTSLLPPPSPP